ncbi:MAG: four helix bundle protein [Anaerolineales bacterium]|nr:four helix bundle protein [Anaerolineales bacterium]
MNSPQKQEDLSSRTRRYALGIIRLYSLLPKSTELQVIGRQMLRSGTSAGAHYAEGQRSKSNKDFISKLEGGLQELEETLYWLDLLAEIYKAKPETVEAIRKETSEPIAIFVTIVKRVKARN